MLADPVPGQTVLVSELVLRFYRHALEFYVDPDGVPTGQHITIRAALRPLNSEYGDLPAHEFGPKRLKTLQATMAKKPKWCRGSVNRATSIIKQAFKWGASEELFPGSVAVNLACVGAIKAGQHGAREKPPIEPVADEIVDATIPKVSELVADVIRVMRLSGARPGEILRVTAARKPIEADPTCWLYKPTRHKTKHKGKSRVIAFGSQKCPRDSAAAHPQGRR